MPSRFVHVVAGVRIFFLKLNNIRVIGGYIGCFYFLATMNNAAVNTGVSLTYF